MAVYVDGAQHAFGRMVMCHMFAPDLDQLHAMADAIGVQRRWFQDPTRMPKVSWPHYDIAKGKRAQAVRLGAIECDKYQMVAMSCVVMRINYGVYRDPLRWFSNYLLPERERISAWLADQGFDPLFD